MPDFIVYVYELFSYTAINVKCWLQTSHLSLTVEEVSVFLPFLDTQPFCHGTRNYWGLPPLWKMLCQCLRWRSSQVIAEKETSCHNYRNQWGLCKVKPKCMVALLTLHCKSPLENMILALVDILTLCKCDSFPGVDKSKFPSLRGKRFPTFLSLIHRFPIHLLKIDSSLPTLYAGT